MDRKGARNGVAFNTCRTHAARRALRHWRPTKRQIKLPPPKPQLSVVNNNSTEYQLARNSSSPQKNCPDVLLSAESGLGTTIDFSNLATENGRRSNLVSDFTSSDDNSKVRFNISNFDPSLVTLTEENCVAQSSRGNERRSSHLIKNFCEVNDTRLRLRNHQEEKLCVSKCQNENGLVKGGLKIKQNGRLSLENKNNSSLEFILWARDEKINLDEITDLDVALHVINEITQIKVKKDWNELLHSLSEADAEKDRLQCELAATNKLLEKAIVHRNKRRQLSSFLDEWKNYSENLIEEVIHFNNYTYESE
uniref:Uncharacterized protein n=1 Tax=Strigamia maritima TaxID=126957 RepID=T1JLG1_STRMM